MRRICIGKLDELPSYVVECRKLDSEYYIHTTCCVIQVVEVDSFCSSPPALMAFLSVDHSPQHTNTLEDILSCRERKTTKTTPLTYTHLLSPIFGFPLQPCIWNSLFLLFLCSFLPFSLEPALVSLVSSSLATRTASPSTFARDLDLTEFKVNLLDLLAVFNVVYHSPIPETVSLGLWDLS